jgi:two-component system, response regulator, stage 0 sporulation protein F
MPKILLIDDELSIRNFFYDFLTRNGYAVSTASRGDQALAFLPTENPDLVLMDVKMPGETGLSLLRKLRAKDSRLPIVIFSGYVTSDLEKEAFDSGAVEVIRKDVGPAEFCEKIKKIFEAKSKIFNQAQAARKEKILVVDDEEPIRNFLTDFFTRKGFTVLQASRGEEAVAITQKEKPSIILLDINMPGMDGLLTLKKIREFDKNVGVVMATSVQDEQIATEAAQLGSYHYVLKPFDLQYLELVVMTRLLIAS